jgi:hypothetical protein
MGTTAIDVTRSVEITEVVGRLPHASNATLLARDSEGQLWVYKPDQGESPLWDFPYQTLSKREIISFEVSTAMGLDIIPLTLEADGVYGPGSAQAFLDEDEEFDPRPWFEDQLEPSLWPFAVFDIVANNADRKVGHLLREAGTGRVWGIDQGLTFHPMNKLRTVLWGFAGQAIPEDLMDAVERLRTALSGGVRHRIVMMLGEAEADALAHRVELLLLSGTHPLPPTDRPAVPWPMW